MHVGKSGIYPKRVHYALSAYWGGFATLSALGLSLAPRCSVLSFLSSVMTEGESYVHPITTLFWDQNALFYLVTFPADFYGHLAVRAYTHQTPPSAAAQRTPMTETTKTQIATLIVLSCYHAVAGTLPRGMFDFVARGLAGKVWEDAEDLQRGAVLLAQQFLLETAVEGGSDLDTLWAVGEDGEAN